MTFPITSSGKTKTQSEVAIALFGVRDIALDLGQRLDRKAGTRDASLVSATEPSF